MNKVTQLGNGIYQTNSRKIFNPTELPIEDAIKCAEFSYDMTFGKRGYHNACANGSDYVRSEAEIFASAFQGKAAEFAISNYLYSIGADVSEPDLRVYGKGKWDNGDLFIGDDCISVKSSASYVNVLRLNKNDFYLDGRYKYDHSVRRGLDDYFMLARVMTNENETVRKATLNINEIIQRDSLSADAIESLIVDKTWVVDIPGFITHGDFVEEMIANDFVLNKGDVLDRYVKMSYDTYYAQTGDLKSLDAFRDDELENSYYYDDNNIDDDLEL